MCRRAAGCGPRDGRAHADRCGVVALDRRLGSRRAHTRRRRTPAGLVPRRLHIYMSVSWLDSRTGRATRRCSEGTVVVKRRGIYPIYTRIYSLARLALQPATVSTAERPAVQADIGTGGSVTVEYEWEEEDGVRPKLTPYFSPNAQRDRGFSHSSHCRRSTCGHTETRPSLARRSGGGPRRSLNNTCDSSLRSERE